MTIAPSPRIRVRAIAFDLDGTLLDTIHDLATAINLMLARLNQPARALALYETDYERVLGRETVVFPGVREGLERLASAGFGLACVTNKTNRFVRPHLAQAGLPATAHPGAARVTE